MEYLWKLIGELFPVKQCGYREWTGLDCNIVISEFELESRSYIDFRTNTLGKGIKSLIFSSTRYIVPLPVFYKDGFVFINKVCLQIIYLTRGAFKKFSDFFVQKFKIVVDSWKCSMLLLYISWDDWPIFMISGLNEQQQQELEYTLLKLDCHSWWISKM